MKPAPSTPRRKPAQSRSRATAQAIRDAFVQLLVEKGYEKVSIRQVIALAGVGIGSFYEYFSSKDELAAVCIHLHIKDIAAVMRERIDVTRGEPLPARVDALLAAQCAPALAEPEQWRAIFLLERKVSGTDAFRAMYREFVGLWQEALANGPDWPAGAAVAESAFVAHAMAYSLISQALMTASEFPNADTMRRTVRTAVHGYLSVIAPLAYRLHRFDA
jgi:AcrR family transcriptional regulator